MVTRKLIARRAGAHKRSHRLAFRIAALAVAMLASSSTGFVHDNRVAAAVTTLAGTVALASAYGAENYTLNTANKSGILDPVADT